MIVTCLLGDPIEQSVSPHMYNYFAKMAGLPYYSHVKLRVPAEREENLKEAINSAVFLDFKGINITIPYKIKALDHVHEIDPQAKAVGMVNAIVNNNGKLTGYNTDSIGALSAIEQRLRKIRPSDKIVVFGAGGAARAIVAAICKETKNIVLLNRKEDFKLATALQKDMEKLGAKIHILELSEQNIIEETAKANIVIHATRLGMVPNVKETIITREQFNKINKLSPVKNKMFFDVVFNPYTTEFLKIAEGFGAKICQGLYMTVHQGAASFELWTGKKVAKKHIEDVHKIIKKKMGIKS